MLDHYHYEDFARKVVGVGSVGTEAMMILLMGDREDDPLFLQIKEASTSVLAPYAGASEYEHQGERVVQGQRLMQAASDASSAGSPGPASDGHEFYVRQLRDMKGSAAVETMTPARLALYGELCGATLARAHARTGDAAKIAGYLGDDDTFDRALERFAVAYADQNDADYAAFTKAAESSASRSSAACSLRSHRDAGHRTSQRGGDSPDLRAGAPGFRTRRAARRGEGSQLLVELLPVGDKWPVRRVLVDDERAAADHRRRAASPRPRSGRARRGRHGR